MAVPYWKRAPGVIQRGHGVASGTALESPYPQGTIVMQRPYFEARGLDLAGFFAGTLNLSISPHRFQIIQPEYTFRQVEWTDRHPPEDFSFSRCRVIFRQTQHECLIYYPHPDTKQRHFQDASTIELLAPFIADLTYGSKVELEYNALEIRIS